MADAKIEITGDLVRDLLQEQHPDLAVLAIREVAGGWGNQMWRLGDELAVRMQRMDPTRNYSSRSGSGYLCWPRSCRSRCRPQCDSANRPSASPSTGP